jgi:hypothetical protein
MISQNMRGIVLKMQNGSEIGLDQDKIGKDVGALTRNGLARFA